MYFVTFDESNKSTGIFSDEVENSIPLEDASLVYADVPFLVLEDNVIRLPFEEELKAFSDKNLYDLEVTKVRNKRNSLLAESDLLMLLDRFNKLDEEEQSTLLKYRQDLRDVTKQKGYPFAVVFPTLN